MSTSDKDLVDDKHFMRLALLVAREALRHGEVPVGCLLVNDKGVVVSHGANQVNACRDSTRHAEVVAIDRLLTGSVSTDQLRLPEEYIQAKQSAAQRKEGEKKNVWSDAWTRYEPEATTGWAVADWSPTESPSTRYTLYVTCEPCIMCAAAIQELGSVISRVVFGCRNDKFGGCGSILSVLTGERIKAGVLEKECVSLLRDFYKGENAFAPVNKRKKKDNLEQASVDVVEDAVKKTKT